ncbi:serine hydrolase [Streptomyces sp. MnatMP-M27]|uniref:serine hydrolase domain-containing protein n=1 Tax=Streptomyces sp. MnatMP-M27 TaxID=1839768 RepID=UPI00210EBDEE|nr:serine hydrolase domain-containing protein [Streptomyces sp. MnatMP-M27]
MSQAADQARRTWSEEQLPSMAVAVCLDGQAVTDHYWGSADLETLAPARADTAYLLASVTKSMTAVAVGLLAREGRLALGDAVDTLLGAPIPALPDCRQPTVRELLGHRAGVGRYYRFFYADESAEKPAFRKTLSQTQIMTPPGSTFEYSNLGYGILDAVIEAVTGKQAGKATKELLERYIGPTSLSIGPSYAGSAASTATRYGADGVAYPEYDVEHRGGTLAWMTISDLARFGAACLANGAIGRTGVIDTLTGAPDEDSGYGLGWCVDEYAGIKAISHAGDMGGVSSYLLCFPDHGLSIAAVTNRTGSDAPQSLAADVGSRVLTALCDRSVEVACPSPLVLPTPCALPARLDGHWTGELETDEGKVAVGLSVSAGLASLDLDQDRADLSGFPTDSLDLRAAGRLDHAAEKVGSRETSVTVEARRFGDTLHGRIYVTDDLGARLRASLGEEGGAPALRFPNCVSYPILLRRDT